MGVDVLRRECAFSVIMCWINMLLSDKGFEPIRSCNVFYMNIN